MALRSCGHLPPGRERIVRIKDTLRLDEVYVSKAIVEDVNGRDDVEVLGEAFELFDDEGGLMKF
jgi:hypothetical protein